MKMQRCCSHYWQQMKARRWQAELAWNTVKNKTSHVTHHTSHLTPQHVTRHTSHLTPHTSHLTYYTSHVTPHTSHVTRHTSHVTRHTSPLACRSIDEEAWARYTKDICIRSQIQFVKCRRRWTTNDQVVVVMRKEVSGCNIRASCYM
jgi:hypothetical protein